MKPEVPIAVAMPTIPPRAIGGTSVVDAYKVPGIVHLPGAGLYEQAVTSVANQTVEPAGGLHVALDVDREGAAATRQRALDLAAASGAEFVAFLDDDDLWYPRHLEVHYGLLREHNADVAYSWFDGNQPFGPNPPHRGLAWNPQTPHHITMCITVRTKLAVQVPFRSDLATAGCANEDWAYVLGLNGLGAKFVGTGEVTWHYRIHRTNTSGLPSRWQP